MPMQVKLQGNHDGYFSGRGIGAMITFRPGEGVELFKPGDDRVWVIQALSGERYVFSRDDWDARQSEASGMITLGRKIEWLPSDGIVALDDYMVLDESDGINDHFYPQAGERSPIYDAHGELVFRSLEGSVTGDCWVVITPGNPVGLDFYHADEWELQELEEDFKLRFVAKSQQKEKS